MLPHARRDRDPKPLPQPLRPAARARALPQRDFHPPADLRDVRGSRRVRAHGAGARRLSAVRPRLATRSTSSAGTATSIPTRSTPTTSSRSPDGSICRRPCTRPSRARTSSSARSARASSTATRRRSPLPYHHSNIQSEEAITTSTGTISPRVRASGWCHAAPQWPAARPQPGARGGVARRDVAPRSWRSCGTPSGRSG